MILEATIPTFLSQPDEEQKLTKWLFETIQPYIKGKILEMESGHGAMAALFAENAIKLHLSESVPTYRRHLREKFQGIEAIRMVHNVDFHHPAFSRAHANLCGAFKTIIALNVVEHGFYDKLTLQNASHLLAAHGRLVVIIPSFTALYDGLDIPLAEWKKYNRKSIKKFLTGFKIVKTINFNYASNPEIEHADLLGLSSLVIAQKID